MSGPEPIDRDPDVAAGLYAAGLMDAAEARAFEARLAAEPQLRAALKTARERFLELDTTAAPLPPSDGLWGRIEADLGERAPVVALAARRTAPAPTAAATARTGPDFWRGFAAASLVAAILGGAFSALVRPVEPRLVVVLLDAAARPVSIVEAVGDRRIRVVPLDAIEVPAGRTLQVWTLPDPATGPVSMGLLTEVTATVLDGPALPAPKANQLYEITIEPAGGSPTGRPTGPIVGKGFAKAPRI